MISANIDDTTPSTQASDRSESGSRQALATVGIARMPSAQIANIVVIQGLPDHK